MAFYIMAMSINSTAKKEHPDLSHHVNQSLEVFTKNKVKIEKLYATLGRYDFLAVFEVEDQSLAFRIASEIISMGVLETETWPVIPFEDFSKLI